MKTQSQTYEVWAYDVWGNARDGFDVNDRSKCGTITVNARREVFNTGTPHEFTQYSPTPTQLARALGFVGCEYEWSDGGYEIVQKSNGKPIGQLILVSSDT